MLSTFIAFLLGTDSHEEPIFFRLWENIKKGGVVAMRRLATFILLLSVIGLLFSCAGGYYCHPTKTAQDFERDKYDCEGIGVQRAHQWGFSGNPFIISDEMERCLMIKHGWTRCGQ